MLRRRRPDLLVLAGYIALSFVFFGWRLLPHPGRVMLGKAGLHDPEINIWSFGWWPHAIGSWTNPFISHALYAPTGVNLTWTPSTPGLALVFSPLTALVGPVASFNVALLLAPAVSAWAAYLLCRRLTGSLWAAVVGGYLFGFSTAELRQFLAGNINLSAVFVFPLVALVLVRFTRRELTGRGLAWRLGALLAVQLWISTEFTLTLTLMLAIGLALAFVLVRDARPRLRSAIVPIAGGYALGALFAAPFVYYVLVGPSLPKLFTYGPVEGTDPLGFIVPNGVNGIGGSWFLSFADHVPNGDLAYIGIPTVLIVSAFALGIRRTKRAPWGRFLLAALAISAVIALGSTLAIDGHRLIGLPWWSAAFATPGLQNAVPYRFAIFVALAAGVIVALWTAAASRPLLRFVAPALAVAAIAPAVWQSSYPSFFPGHPARLAFFTDGLYKSCLAPDETLAIFPFGAHGDSLLWQSETGFRFRLAADGLQPHSSFSNDQIVSDLNAEIDAKPTTDRLLAFAALHHVDRVLSVPSNGYPTRAMMRAFGRVQLIGGVLVAPACGTKSLATRNLTRYVTEYRQQEAAGRSNIAYCTGGGFTTVPLGLAPPNAEPAIFVAGKGLTCDPPPPGYTHHGFATEGVPADTYLYYSP